MICIADNDMELVLWAMTSGAAFGLIVPHDGAFFPVDVRATGFLTTAPTAESDHFVVLVPITERIVRGMNNDEPTTVGYEFFKSGLRRLWPRRSPKAKIGEHDVVRGEIRMKVRIGLRFSMFVGLVRQRVLGQVLVAIHRIFCS